MGESVVSAMMLSGFAVLVTFGSTFVVLVVFAILVRLASFVMLEFMFYLFSLNVLLLVVVVVVDWSSR